MKTAGMLRESLRLCQRLLRLAAAASKNNGNSKNKQASSSQSSAMQELLDVVGILVAGTVASACPMVDPAAKADALGLVPFLRPCLTRRAQDYGQSRPGPDATAGEEADG